MQLGECAVMHFHWFRSYCSMLGTSLSLSGPLRVLHLFALETQISMPYGVLVIFLTSFSSKFTF
eukprot:c11163_g1_i1 orf=216-407(+)